MNDVPSVFQRHQVNYHLYADDKQACVSVPVSDLSRARTALVTSAHGVLLYGKPNWFLFTIADIGNSNYWYRQLIADIGN